MGLKGKLLSLTKSGLEKRVELPNIEKAKIGINKVPVPSYPYVTIRQIIRNGSEMHLKINKIYMSLKVNDRDLDKIELFDLETISPRDLDFYKDFKITKLNQVISDFKDYSLEIKASGKIELQSRFGTKIQKDIGGEITIDPSEWA